MGRHGEALEIYPAAIDAQRTCQQRLPNSDVMRGVLSKMYYNFGQSLQVEHRWPEAVKTAVARRELWDDNSERLLSVAAELADLRAAMRQDGSHVDEVARSVDREVLTTLQRSYDRGWPPTVDLNAEKQFAAFQQNAEYAAKVAELNQRSLRTAGERDRGVGATADESN
jgi:hypothetical protein